MNASSNAQVTLSHVIIAEGSGARGLTTIATVDVTWSFPDMPPSTLTAVFGHVADDWTVGIAGSAIGEIDIDTPARFGHKLDRRWIERFYGIGTPPAPDLDIVLKQALVTLLWSEIDDDGMPLDSEYEISDVDADVVANLKTEIESFVRGNAADLEGMDVEQIGHDFTLTRNGHGAGFWDRGLGERGDRLTAACKAYGSLNLYVGDDGKVYGL